MQNERMDRVKQLFSVFIAVIVLFDVFGAGIGRAPDGRIQVENLKLSGTGIAALWKIQINGYRRI